MQKPPPNCWPRPETSPGCERHMQSQDSHENWCHVAVKHISTGVHTDGKSATSMIQPLKYPCLLVHTAFNLDFSNAVGLGILDQCLISLFHFHNESILGSE